jgi:hypothetical protein
MDQRTRRDEKDTALKLFRASLRPLVFSTLFGLLYSSPVGPLDSGRKWPRVFFGDLAGSPPAFGLFDPIVAHVMQ